jgi:signal transduction histidine kinase
LVAAWLQDIVSARVGRLYSRGQSIGVSDVTNPLLATRLGSTLPRGIPDERVAPWTAGTRLGWIGRRRLLVLLDLAAFLVVAATFAQLGPPELLFHVVFVILTAEAFLFGRRICLQRIAALSVALVLYASMPSLGIPEEPLELTEWPLMFTIAVLVAWMADREQSVGRRYAELYRETRDRLVRAQEEERGRIARDLHDGIGQTLTALTLTLDAAASAKDGTASAKDGTASAHGLDRARELAREAIGGTREIAEGIRPPRLAERGLASALRAMASMPGGQIEVSVQPEADVHFQSAGAELETYRIAEEAVRNAVRHAGAIRISVSFERTPAGLRLDVTDDGVGFERSMVHARRLGIVGMHERAEAIGATLKVVSAPARGTRVRLVIPASVAFPGPVGT